MDTQPLHGTAILLGSYPREISDNDIRDLFAPKQDTEQSCAHTNGGNPTGGQGNSVLENIIENMVFGDNEVPVDDSLKGVALFTRTNKRRKKSNPSPTLLRFMNDEEWVPFQFRTLDSKNNLANLISCKGEAGTSALETHRLSQSRDYHLLRLRRRLDQLAGNSITEKDRSRDLHFSDTISIGSILQSVDLGFPQISTEESSTGPTTHFPAPSRSTPILENWPNVEPHDFATTGNTTPNQYLAPTCCAIPPWYIRHRLLLAGAVLLVAIVITIFVAGSILLQSIQNAFAIGSGILTIGGFGMGILVYVQPSSMVQQDIDIELRGR